MGDLESTTEPSMDGLASPWTHRAIVPATVTKSAASPRRPCCSISAKSLLSGAQPSRVAPVQYRPGCGADPDAG